MGLGVRDMHVEVEVGLTCQAAWTAQAGAGALGEHREGSVPDNELVEGMVQVVVLVQLQRSRLISLDTPLGKTAETVLSFRSALINYSRDKS